MVLSRTLLVHGEVVVMMGANLWHNLTLLVNYSAHSGSEPFDFRVG